MSTTQQILTEKQQNKAPLVEWEPKGFGKRVSTQQMVQMRKSSGLTGNSLLDHLEQQKPNIQRKPKTASEPKSVHQTAAQGLQGAPQALPHLGPIQNAFGKHDVTQVQAHVGGAAEKATKQMGALAYATGNSVAFKQQPDLHTAAHEAAHIVQQRGGVQLKAGVGQPGDRYEQHADTVADAVVQGKSAQNLLDPYAGSASSKGVQCILTDNDDMGSEPTDRPQEDLLSDEKNHRLERSGEALEEKDKLLKLADRARRPERNPKFDAIQFTYHMLKHFLPNAQQQYEVAGVGYEESLPGIRVKRIREAKKPHVNIIVGKAFVVETTEANWNYQVIQFQKAFDQLDETVAGKLDAKAPGSELERLSIRFHMAPGIIKDGGWQYALKIEEGGATGSITLSPTHVRIDIIPFIFIDAAGATNATFHGFTFRFDEKKGGIASIQAGKDVRKSGLGGPLGDFVVETVIEELRKILRWLMVGTCFDRPGFNPFETPSDELKKGLDQVAVNWQAYQAKHADGDEEPEEPGYGLDAISDLGASVDVTYKPAYAQVKDGSGIQLEEGARFRIAVSTSGTAADIKDKGVAGAKFEKLRVSAPNRLHLIYGGHTIASLHSIALKRGVNIKANITLNPSEDLLEVIRKEHPNWFTNGLNEVVEGVDAITQPFYLIFKGLGDFDSPETDQPTDQAFRKKVTASGVALLQNLAEDVASSAARTMLLDNSARITSVLGISERELLQFLGIKPAP